MEQPAEIDDEIAELFLYDAFLFNVRLAVIRGATVSETFTGFFSSSAIRRSRFSTAVVRSTRVPQSVMSSRTILYSTAQPKAQPDSTQVEPMESHHSMDPIHPMNRILWMMVLARALRLYDLDLFKSF